MFYTAQLLWNHHCYNQLLALNVGNVAHQLKTYDILLIAILPQQRVSHTAYLLRKSAQ